MLQDFNKKINIILKSIIIIFGSLLLVNCSGNNKIKNFMEPGSNSQSNSRQSADSFAFYGEDISPEKETELLAENVIYFGYDKDDIVHRYELVLLAHAKKMLANPDLKLRIDGHTDERGSAEYNIGLAERRAKAVVRFIELRGIRSDRLVSVSYGKEKPAMNGHDEEAWRLNRRAELTYE